MQFYKMEDEQTIDYDVYRLVPDRVRFRLGDIHAGPNGVLLLPKRMLSRDFETPPTMLCHIQSEEALRYSETPVPYSPYREETGDPCSSKGLLSKGSQSDGTPSCIRGLARRLNFEEDSCNGSTQGDYCSPGNRSRAEFMEELQGAYGSTVFGCRAPEVLDFRAPIEWSNGMRQIINCSLGICIPGECLLCRPDP